MADALSHVNLMKSTANHYYNSISMHSLATTGNWTINDAWGTGIKAVQDTCPKETHKCYTPDKFFCIPFSCILY